MLTGYSLNRYKILLNQQPQTEDQDESNQQNSVVPRIPMLALRQLLINHDGDYA
jgi:hypothetical protein